MLCTCVYVYVLCLLCSCLISVRENVRKLIQQYFVQLTQGCGDESCSNTDCASGSGHLMNPTDAATKALALATSYSKGQAKLCVKEAYSSGSVDDAMTSSSTCAPQELHVAESAFLQKLTHISAVKAKHKKMVTLSLSEQLPSSDQVTRLVHVHVCACKVCTCNVQCMCTYWCIMFMY